MCRLPSRHVFVFFLLSEKSFDSSIVKNITREVRTEKSSKKIWFIWDSLKRNSLTKMNGLLCPGNETITLIKDICNPCGTDDGLTHCSIGCIDANYTQRKWLSNHKLTKLTISIPLFFTGPFRHHFQRTMWLLQQDWWHNNCISTNSQTFLLPTDNSLSSA